jgi:3-methyladenine DNA glycosylase AlkD
VVRLILDEAKTALADLADPARAVQQQAYMKSAMPYRGVTMPRIRRLVMNLARRHRPDLETIRAASRQLWDDAAWREERHVAIGLTGLKPAHGRIELVELYQYQATSGAWWDYVDRIAHRVAVLHEVHPAETAALARSWSSASSLWLRRLAIIGQLRRGARTDTELLAEVIRANAEDREFFIRKAIGWALRDYAYTDPDWVRRFTSEVELSTLSRREALKHI